MNAPVIPLHLAAGEFKSEVKPIWCPGCGHYGVLAALERALAALGRPAHEIALVSGIGCSSRAPAYTTAYGFHGVHGRALPLATGLKLARPDLEVIAIGGDGDGYSIGGNHFIHACRRNVNMAYIVMDNRVYGMTKGQPSPTTEPDWEGPLAPHGTGLPVFSPLALAIAAGANFVARGYSGEPNELARLIVEGIRWPGFALIEVLSPCLTYRPEQKEWKSMVHERQSEPCVDAPTAARQLLEDDGYSLGIFFRREPGHESARDAAREQPLREPPAPLAEIEREFAL
jgi:2-oxoglutarate ferredoxin oxidoreductase subunit beta